MVELAPVSSRRRIRVEQVMGTAISVDLRDNHLDEGVLDRVFAWFDEVDRRFSPFKTESEVSRLGRGEVTLEECHPDLREVLEACEEIRVASGGSFNAWKHRVDGRLDPSAFVKGWSVDRADAILESGGARNFCINAGGDVLARGEAEPGRPWRVGIRHPLEQAICAVVEVRDLAVATSGTYERGEHILDPRTCEPANELLSMTVVGRNLGLADAYATAAFVIGLEGLRWIGGLAGFDACAITRSRRIVFTHGMRRLVAD